MLACDSDFSLIDQNCNLCCSRRINNLLGSLWSCWVFRGDDTNYVAVKSSLSKR